MSKRLVPPVIAMLFAAVPASAWAAANGGVSVPATPLPSVAQGGTAYASVPLPAHPRKRRTPRRPAAAPAAVRLAIAAANRLQGLPYRFGGGHASFEDSAYDCSGTVSYMLHGAGLLATPLDSTELMSYGVPGPGRWITIYSNPDHAYAVVAGLRLDTSGSPSGPRWRPAPRSAAGFTARHPAGL